MVVALPSRPSTPLQTILLSLSAAPLLVSVIALPGTHRAVQMVALLQALPMAPPAMPKVATRAAVARGAARCQSCR